MTTLVKNGTVVTASDRYQADIFIDKGVVSLIGQGLNLPADTVVDASGQLVMPGGIDVHTHLDMPFGGTTSADDFETGTIAAAHGGTTTIVDFAIQNFGEGLLPRVRGLDEEGRGQGRHRLRVPHDRARADRPGLARHGHAWRGTRASPRFKLFMAYPGVFRWTTRPSSGRCCKHARERRARLHARRERRRHRHAREGGAAQGPDGAQVPRAHAAARAPRARPPAAPSRSPRWRACPIYIVHLSCADALEKVKQARDRACPPTPRPARSTCSSPTRTTSGPASRARST